ncbi:sigma-70 family RNA polymerase sigma factor [Pelagibius sp. CAU 1746]|uniref:sigma-70 family RNA polymerase sigma factor n=1 Tax=Pelagibius sp. CAU 1746 TaxID=3140370 RepID=UPI00325AFFE2
MPTHGGKYRQRRFSLRPNDPAGTLDDQHRFEALVLPHLDAAYNLARWLARDEGDADDIVQDAYLRAFRYIGNLKGEDAKPWLLGIVRNSFRSHAARRRRDMALPLPEDRYADEAEPPPRGAPPADPGDDPELKLIKSEQEMKLGHLVGSLPIEFREVIVLREFEDLSYKAIAEIVGVPLGTVMSRLARARKLLRDRWLAQVESAEGELLHGLR